MDQQSEFSVIFYEKEDGSMPAMDFILGLDEKLKAKTLRNINLLAKVGPALRKPESSPLDDGIFEIRTKAGTNLTRVLYFFYVGKKAVLTNVFIKKTQKTPRKEIIPKILVTIWKSRVFIKLLPDSQSVGKVL